MAKTIRNRGYKYRRKVALNPLQQMCGHWINGFESPPIRIFRTGQGYRISFEYQLNPIVTVPIKRTVNMLEIDFFGRMELAYDQINDLLLIAGEGVYFRANDR